MTAPDRAPDPTQRPPLGHVWHAQSFPTARAPHPGFYSVADQGAVYLRRGERFREHFR